MMPRPSWTSRTRSSREFKAQHLVSMPEQEQTNLALLGGMNSQLDATTQALTRAQEDKSLNETLLSQQEANWKASQVGLQNPETQDQQLEALQEQLAALLAKYTPEHPDVIKLKTQIEDLKKRMAETPAAKTSPASTQASLREPPVTSAIADQDQAGQFQHCRPNEAASANSGSNSCSYKAGCRQVRSSSNNLRNCRGITKRPRIFTMIY